MMRSSGLAYEDENERASIEDRTGWMEDRWMGINQGQGTEEVEELSSIERS